MRSINISFKKIITISIILVTAIALCIFNLSKPKVYDGTFVFAHTQEVE